MAIKAILFDHDGTLADSEVVHYQFWANVLAAHGIDVPESHYIAHYTGVSEQNTARHLREFFGVNASVESLVDAKRQQAHHFHADQFYPLMPGVAELLDALRTAGIRMAVVSGSAHFALEANLNAAGLRDYFELVASGEDRAHNKPAPDVYRWALEQLDLPAAECIAVEDTYAGLSAAKGAGLFTCVIPNRFSAHQDFSAADLRFGHMSEFQRWFFERQQ